MLQKSKKKKNGGRHMEAEKEQSQSAITFADIPMQKFFDTLAMILSRKYNMEITVKVTKKEEQQQEKAVV